MSEMQGEERTGLAAVDEVLEALDTVEDQSPADQVAVFERAHETLRRTLDDAPSD